MSTEDNNEESPGIENSSSKISETKKISDDVEHANVPENVKSKWKRYIIIISILITISAIAIITIFAFKYHKEKEDGETAHEWTEYRLPSFISPSHYNIFLKPDLSSNIYTGNVTIQFSVKKKANFIVIHMNNLHKGKVAIKSNSAEFVIQKDDYDKEMGQLFMRIKEYFLPNKSYNLEIDFQGYLNMSFEGFFATTHKIGTETNKIAYTNFKPNNARKAFPCFDEPAMKSTFQLTMEHDRKYTAYFNAPVFEKKEYDNNLFRTTFKTSEKISTYVVAFALCDYKYFNKTRYSVMLRVLVPDNNEVWLPVNLEIITRSAMSAQNVFESSNLFPFTNKFDVVAVPILFSSGLENWCLSFLPRINLYGGTAKIDINSEQRRALALARVFSYQSLGNAITMEWWNHFWIAESFSIFNQYFAVENADWKMMEQFVVDIKQPALYTDGFQSIKPLYTNFSESDEVDSMFDSINYQKGASVINMLENVLGKNRLEENLRKFWKNKQFTTINSEDFWKFFSKDDSLFINAWIYKKGFPLVHVKLTQGKIELHQKPFNFVKPVEDPKSIFEIPDNFQPWRIPIRYITEKKEKGIFWLNTKEGYFSITNGNKWIKLNAESVGFYRVMYNKELFSKIREDIINNYQTFAVTDRSDLLDDVFTFAKYNIIGVNEATQFIEYLKKEDEFVPWKTALHHLNYIHNMLYENENIITKFQVKVSELMNQIITDILGNPGALKYKKLCNLILPSALKFKHEKAKQDAGVLFKSLGKDFKIENLEIRSFVLNYGIIHAETSETWDKYLRELKKTTEPSYIKLYIEAMAQTTKWDQHKIYFEQFLTNLDVVSASYLFPALAETGYNCRKAWTFFKEHGQLFKVLFRNHRILRHFASVLIKNLNTQADYVDAYNYVQKTWPNAKFEEINRALDNLKININCKTHLESMISTWTS